MAFFLLLGPAACGDEIEELIALQKKILALKAAGKYNEAEPLAKELVARGERAFKDRPADLATVYNNLALLYKEQGRYREAEPLYLRALKIDERSLGPDDPNLAISLNNLASLYDDQGKYGQAEPLYLQALQIREKRLGPDHPDVAVSLNNLADLYEEQARYAQAEPLYLRALKIQEQNYGPEHPLVALLLNNLGTLYDDQGRYAEAGPIYRRALRIREKRLGPEHPDVANSLNNLARLYSVQGKSAQAEPLYQRALEIREKTLGPEHPAVATSLDNLAALYDDQAKYAEAEPLYQRALNIRERKLGPDHPLVAASLNNLAWLNSEQGNYAEAEPLFRRALLIREKSLGPDHPDVANSLNNLAFLYRAQGKQAEAERLYERALRIREKSLGGDHRDVATSLNNLASLYDGQKRYAEAEPLYERAIKILETSLGASHPDVAVALNNLALLDQAQGKYAEAERLYQRALQIQEKSLAPSHPDVADSLNNLAVLYYAQGKDAEAEPLLSRAIALWDRAAVAPGTRYWGYFNRARLKWRQKRRSEAVADLRTALRLAEEQRTTFAGAEQERALGFAQFSSAFETMIAWQHDLNDLPAAFEAMERSQARSLVDQMAAAGTDLLAGLPPPEAATLRERDSAARSRVSYLERQLTRLESRDEASAATRAQQRTKMEDELKAARDAAQEAYAAIRNASPALRLASGKDFAPAPLDKVQAWLASRDALLLRYYSAQDQLYLLAVAPNSAARLVTLSLDNDQARALGVAPGPLDSAKLQSLFSVSGTTLTKLLSDPRTASQATVRLAALWKILVPDDVQRLATRGTLGRLMIVPDGPLALVPFEALVVEIRDDPQYLLDLAPPITYGPSAAILYNLAQRQAAAVPRPTKPVLTVGDPAYPSAAKAEQPVTLVPSAGRDFSLQSRFRRHGGELARLPYSAAESQWVADGFAKAGVAVGMLLRTAATEANVRFNVSGRKVVHLACHGLVDESYRNLFGALALAPGKAAENPADDGFLTLAEIYDLNLKSCELAILSACETNYGPQQKGEGAWALSRGFLVAGARRVVASDWLVDDEAAARLVGYFCAAAAQAEKAGGEADFAAQLQAAKRWVRQQEKWKSPYYWATFVLVGPN